jgi:hypothetical protein
MLLAWYVPTVEYVKNHGGAAGAKEDTATPERRAEFIHPSITSLTTPLLKIWLLQVVDIGEANPTR